MQPQARLRSGRTGYGVACRRYFPQEASMAARIDPVEIIARVSDDNGKQRAFEVWRHKATKAGWPVTVESTSLDRPGSECGVVQIEGLRYRIHHAKRVRQRVAVVPTEHHPIAAAVKHSM